MRPCESNDLTKTQLVLIEARVFATSSDLRVAVTWHYGLQTSWPALSFFFNHFRLEPLIHFSSDIENLSIIFSCGSTFFGDKIAMKTLPKKKKVSNIFFHKFWWKIVCCWTTRKIVLSNCNNYNKKPQKQWMTWKHFYMKNENKMEKNKKGALPC